MSGPAADVAHRSAAPLVAPNRRRRPRLAESLNTLAIRLIRLNQHQEALEPMREAADLFRELAASLPDAFRPYLATSLNNLGKLLHELGREEEAQAAAREAQEIAGGG